MTRIIVDADACPVKEEVYRVAGRCGLQVVVASNKGMRVPPEPWIRMVVVEGSFDAVDDWIAGEVAPEDIVVTADIPLASRCIGKGARVLGPRGREFTEEAIGDVLATRTLLAHLRETGTITGGPGGLREEGPLALPAEARSAGAGGSRRGARAIRAGPERGATTPGNPGAPSGRVRRLPGLPSGRLFARPLRRPAHPIRYFFIIAWELGLSMPVSSALRVTFHSLRLRDSRTKSRSIRSTDFSRMTFFTLMSSAALFGTFASRRGTISRIVERCACVIARSFVRMTARWMAFLQLADVARPVVVQQDVEGLRGDFGHPPPELLAEDLEEVVGEGRMSSRRSRRGGSTIGKMLMR